MSKKTKLELTWIGKDERPKLEPRILIEDPARSYHAALRRSDADIFDNMLIKGDNLLALKALERQYEGQVKCIYIDPPYNTGSAFTHYDDGLEHSVWLSLLRDRLQILQSILAIDGSIWISADDNESHYLKVLCDEVFGRRNFVSNVIWQKKYAPSNDALWLSENHDHILVYAKEKEAWRPKPLARTSAQNTLYKNPDNDPRGPWMSDNYTCAKTADERPNLYYEITNPNTGEKIWPNRSRVWAFERSTHEKNVAENRIYWGRSGNNSTPRLKKYLNELKRSGTVPQTIWLYDEVGHTQDAKREAKALVAADPFPTPKPEKLISRILEIATSAGDLVLDSFAGSGTTGAVAHKMGRSWIMVELGEHCDTHILPRMKKVIDGDDKGGVTEVCGWKGGGGFRYFNLAPSLLEQDKYGNWVISKDYNPAMLAEAMCKHMGYTYAPSLLAEEYWSHGYATEKSFIYVTTQQLTHDACRKISEDVGPERSLVVCCKAFSANPDSFENLILVKIPSAILTQCEWGRDDYSLNIAKLPLVDDAGDEDLEPASKEEMAAPKRKKKIAAKDRFGDLSGLDLFDDLGSDTDKSEG